MSNFIAKLVGKIKKENKYPRVMVDSDSMSVYMMTKPKCGVKLFQGSTGVNSGYPVGEYREDWTDWDMINYDGVIELRCGKDA